jgi:hypothetical protein
MLKMAFQVVELILDADDNVVDRPLSLSNTQRCSRYNREHRKKVLQAEGDFWWAITGDGMTRVRFIIEGV